jgi:uncharacterized protein (TIGR00369 family)
MNPTDFAPIPPARERAIRERLNGEPFLALLGLRFEEIRGGYARCRMPFRADLLQGGGVVHGGAIASLLDSVGIGAILSAADERPRRLVTLSLSIQLLAAVVDADVVAEARLRRRGRRVAFLDVEARDPSGREVAHAEIVALVDLDSST